MATNPRRKRPAPASIDASVPVAQESIRVSATIRFSPALSTWLTQSLDQEIAPGSLLQTMVANDMEPGAAQAIVNAFVMARSGGTPVPVDSVPLPEAATEYVYEAPILAPGSRIRTCDRVIPVIARSERPALALLGDLLSADECAQLIDLAKPRLRPSTVVDPGTGRDVIADYRRSLGMFFRPQENALIARLDRRLAEVMNCPEENGEGLQVLYYSTGAQSAPHFDFLVPSNAANQASLARSGQRISTLITYLNDGDGGGETVFPETGTTVTPQRGNALYFEYCNSLGQVDPRSVHGGNPILRGEKWVATKWMRQRRFIAAGVTAREQATTARAGHG